MVVHDRCSEQEYQLASLEETLVRATLHCGVSNLRCAQTSEAFSICQCHVRARACLTPMPRGWGLFIGFVEGFGNSTRILPSTSSPAPTHRHRTAFTGLRKSSPAVLGLPSRARITSLDLERFGCNPTVTGWRMVLARARVRHETTRRFAPRLERGASRPDKPPASQRRHLRLVTARRCAPNRSQRAKCRCSCLAPSALFGQRTTPDSPAFPLTRSIAPRLAAIPTARKLPRQAEQLVRSRRKKNPEVARLRLLPRRSNMARCSACRPGHRNMPRGFARPGHRH